MNLRDFVSVALADIFAGVTDAKLKVGDKGEINPVPMGSASDYAGKGGFMTAGHRKIASFVEFDVAVAISDGTETQGKIGVQAGVFNLGSQGQSKAENSTLSRIRFQIPVSLP